jgi:hypothetical protein
LEPTGGWSIFDNVLEEGDDLGVGEQRKGCFAFNKVVILLKSSIVGGLPQACP